MSQTIFDRALVNRRADRSAAGASDHDFLLRRVAEDFVERLSIIKREFAIAADVGARHGLVGRELAKAPNIGRVVEVEPSQALLAQGGEARLRVCADAEALPFGDGALDLVVSALSLQLVNDLPGALIQIRRALKPDGLFLGATLGGQTLSELRAAWVMAEAEMIGGSSPRVAPFADVRDYGALLQRAGFALPVVDADPVTVTYSHPLALMAEIKAMGGSNPLTERRRVPVTRGLLMRACEIYADQFAETAAGGRVRATFEIITMTAWCPHESQQKPLKPGSAAARLADALGTTERPAGDKAGQ